MCQIAKWLKIIRHQGCAIGYERNVNSDYLAIKENQRVHKINITANYVHTNASFFVKTQCVTRGGRLALNHPP